MTALLDRAVASLRTLPAEQQDNLARALLDWTSDAQAPIALSPEEEVSFETSLAQAKRGEFASDDAVLAVWAKHCL